jgi:hypothetical protein
MEGGSTRSQLELADGNQTLEDPAISVRRWGAGNDAGCSRPRIRSAGPYEEPWTSAPCSTALPITRLTTPASQSYEGLITPENAVHEGLPYDWSSALCGALRRSSSRHTRLHLATPLPREKLKLPRAGRSRCLDHNNISTNSAC